MATKKKAPVTAEVVESNSQTAESEAAAMKDQVAYQLATLLKMAEKLEINLDEIYPRPPAVTTTVVQSSGVPVPLPIPAPTGKPKPGQYLPGGAWVQWTKADLDPEETVTFVPLPIPGIVYPFTDENGYQKIKLDVNGLVCWLTVGVENTINRFFYNVYEAALNGHRELEKFKREGPEYAPWGKKGPDGRQAWQFIPMAATFGMTDDGRSLRVGGPTPLDLTPSEAAGTPASTGEEPK